MDSNIGKKLDGRYELLELIGKCTDQRMFAMYEAIARGVTLEKLAKLSKTKLNEYLAFSNKFCGISVQQHGAIDSYPTLDQMQ